jgi:hypothetical protein
MIDTKYVTFKREDLDGWVDDLRGAIYKSDVASWVERNQLRDSVVIRLRDAFASAALHTYANSIAITAKALGELAPSTRDRLQGIADYFHQRACEADEMSNKLPD